MKFKLVESFAESVDDLKLIDKKDLFGLKLFFISKDKSLKKLKPRQPKSAAGFGMENPYIDRCCFAPQISTCLKAIYTGSDKQTPYYVYVPLKPLANYRFYKCEPHEVMDSYETDEYWCLDPIEITPIFKIMVDKDYLDAFHGDKYSVEVPYKIVKDKEFEGPTYNMLEDFACSYELKFERTEVNRLETRIFFKNLKDYKNFYKCACKHLNEAEMYGDEGSLFITYYTHSHLWDIWDKTTNQITESMPHPGEFKDLQNVPKKFKEEYDALRKLMKKLHDDILKMPEQRDFQVEVNKVVEALTWDMRNGQINTEIYKHFVATFLKPTCRLYERTYHLEDNAIKHKMPRI